MGKNLVSSHIRSSQNLYWLDYSDMNGAAVGMKPNQYKLHCVSSNKKKFTLQCNPLTKSSSYYHPATQESSSKVSSLCFHRQRLLRLQPASCSRKEVSPSEQMCVFVCVIAEGEGSGTVVLFLAGQDAAELVFRSWPARTGQLQASCS